MTEYENDRPLWAAIVANPLDDTPRLVFADYLDETAGGPVPCPRCGGRGFYGKPDHDNPLSSYPRSELTPGGLPKVRCGDCGGGRAELAEVIRLGVELADWPCDCDDEAERVCHDECRGKERGERRRRFLDLHPAACAGLPFFVAESVTPAPLRAALLNQSNWRRGLPGAATLTAAEFLWSVDVLRASVPLVGVTLTTELRFSSSHLIADRGPPRRYGPHHATRNVTVWVDRAAALRRVLETEFPGLTVNLFPGRPDETP